MLVDNLFQSMLIKPAMDGADELLIVSGYATSSMAMRHISQLQVLITIYGWGVAFQDAVPHLEIAMKYAENNLDVPISLVVGMAPLGAVNGFLS